MKLGSVRQHLKLSYLVILLILGSGSVFAQPEKTKTSADEAKAAKKIQDAKSFTEIYTASDEFLKKYPQSQLRKKITDYLAAQVFASKDDKQSVANAQKFNMLITDPNDSDQIVPALVEALIRLKQTDEAFSTAEKYLPRHEDDVTVRLQLSIEGSNKLRAGSSKYGSQTKEYSTQAIQLIEANKKPANLTDADWKDYQTKWLPELYTSLGFAYFTLEDRNTAQTNFEKTVSIDPNNITGWYMLGTVIDGNYQDLAKKYTIASGTEKTETLAKANATLDKVIDIFARVVALTEGNAAYQPLNAQMKQDLESYYKYRHSNSTNGMQELINKYKPTKI